MSKERLIFGPFELDPTNRVLRRNGEALSVSARYLDALILMARQPGALITKQRFLDEVWLGIPVTDDALTQCIATLRRCLGDSATHPAYIETVPRHGYRFVGEVSGTEEQPIAAGAQTSGRTQTLYRYGVAGTTGGGVAGIVGGLLYGFAAALGMSPDGGAFSVVLVVMCLTTLVAAIGGLGVGLGMGVARMVFRGRTLTLVLGGATGGVLTGGFFKLVGVDAMHLITGGSLNGLTGAVEGLVLGAAVGLAITASHSSAPLAALRATALGAVGGFLIAALGGRLMVGSLDLLVHQFADARLRLDPIGSLSGDTGLGTVTQWLVAGFEGAIFATCIVFACRLLRPDELLKPSGRVT